MEISGVYMPTWLAICIPLTYLLYRYGIKGYDRFSRHGIAGPPPRPYIGNMWGLFRKGLYGFDKHLKAEYGNVVGTFQVGAPTLMVYDTDIIKQILVKNFDCFRNRRVFDMDVYPLNKMLTVIKDDHWKHVRNLLTPGFSGSKLRRMTYWMNRTARIFTDNLVAKARADEAFDLKVCAGNFTMDVIAGTAFSLEVDSQNDPNNKFVKAAKNVFISDIRRNPRLVLLFLFPWTSKYISIFPKEATDFFVDAVNKAMETRKEANQERPMDFLELMMNAHIDDPETNPDREDGDMDDLVTEKSGVVWSKTGLTHEELLAQSLIFFLAGYDTTAVTLSYVGYNLACNPEVQDKLIAEIDTVTEGQDEISYDMAKKMPYLGMVIDESLRINPSAPRLDRMTNESTTINGVFFEEGTVVGIPVYTLHHDPELWDDPERFIPERFTPEAKAARDPYAYMPFGMGPRNCIGLRLALLEIKIAVAQVLKKCRFVTCDKTEIPVKLPSLGVIPANGLILKMQERTA